MTTSPSAALVTLPIELRHQILKYAFLKTCAPTHPSPMYKNPLDVQLIFSSTRTHEKNGSWGLTPFSNLFLINKQLMFDAIEVVYAGDFIFQFTSPTNLENATKWLDTIGEKKELIKNIGVCLYTLGTCRQSMQHFAEHIDTKKKECVILVQELVGLTNVCINIAFGRLRYYPGPSEVGRERATVALVDFLSVFRGKKESTRKLMAPSMKREFRRILKDVKKRRDQARELEEAENSSQDQEGLQIRGGITEH